MKPGDLALLFVVCLVWALNLVFARWMVSVAETPPIFFAAVRFALVALALLPFLWPAPRQMGMMALIAMGIGAAHFAFLFIGLANASASLASVVGQLGVPISTILSVLFLGERIGWRRGLGIALSFLGVMIIAVQPEGFTLTTGLAFLLMAALVGSAASILMKRIEPMPALRLQAWVGLFSFLPLLALSFATETGQFAPFLSGDWRVYAATLFAVFAVSIFGHGCFYILLKRYDVSMVTPLTLMTPIWGVALSIALLGEPASPRLFIGAAVALVGVAMIAIRKNARFPEAALGDKIGP